MDCSYNEYTKQKIDFFLKHSKDTGDVKEYDNFTENGVMKKEFSFSDGACWFECMDRVLETGETVIRGCKIPVKAELFRVEFWSTDNSRSQYYYSPVSA